MPGRHLWGRLWRARLTPLGAAGLRLLSSLFGQTPQLASAVLLGVEALAYSRKRHQSLIPYRQGPLLAYEEQQGDNQRPGEDNCLRRWRMFHRAPPARDDPFYTPHRSFCKVQNSRRCHIMLYMSVLALGSQEPIRLRAVHNYFQMKWAIAL